jgi:hypothetical protein
VEDSDDCCLDNIHLANEKPGKRGVFITAGTKVVDSNLRKEPVAT